MFKSLSFVALVLAATAHAERAVKIEAKGPAAVSDVSSLTITTKITNTGDETLKLLKDPHSVLSSWATETFDIVNAQGVSPAFTGVHVRYIPSVAATLKDPAGFTVLAPGQVVSVQHEVGKYWNFTSTGSGAYTFTPSTKYIQAIQLDGALIATSAISTAAVPTTVTLTGKLATTERLSATSLGGSAAVSSAETTLEKRASFRSCSTTRQSQINSAISSAAGLANRAVSHLNANPSGSTLYTTWFGAFTSARRSTVLGAYQRIVSPPASWTYDCTCTDSGTYAYVYPSQYGVVYLCGYFWTAPATGAGSRADTIIHEGTHFTQILGTDDWAYGQSACRSLASSNPTRAVDNADNYAFFSVFA